MTETLSMRIDSETNSRLDRLAKLSGRSKSVLAAEAIAAYVDTEEWQLAEVDAGLKDLEADQVVSHERVARWLRSWGTKSETKAP